VCESAAILAGPLAEFGGDFLGVDAAVVPLGDGRILLDLLLLLALMFKSGP
jgi:hypothetical protein